VWWVLSHLDGIPVISAEQKVNAVLDWESVTADLAAQAPFWEPGTRPAYHGFSFGYLVGEIVRRVSNRSIGTFFREEVAEPLGLDFWIGLPPEHHGRLAPSVDADPLDPDEPLHPVYAAMAQPGTIQALLFMNGNGYFEPGGPDRPASLVAELPSTGGVTNGRGLAEMYAPLSLGGARGAVRLVEPHDVARMAAVRAAAVDAMLLHPIRFTLGFWGNIDNRRSRIGPTDSVIMSDDAFGHPGMGGRIGFADPAGRFSFGYTMNKMGPGTTVNPRGQSLIDAAYRALGYSEDQQGTWAR
jgi:CubicO group peptidase (beta-lactamase class C family)